MNSLLFLVSFSALIYCIDSQYKFYCYENYCSTKGNECPEFSCEDGRIIENATKCGCCHLCIKTLGENADCKKTYYKWEKEIAECGPGLICKGERSTGIDGKCKPSVCLEKKRIYEKSTGSELKPYFECDHFGNFEPSNNDSIRSHIVCINDVLCFCVDKNGKRIFGTDFAKNNAPSKEMKCDCSQDINDFPKTVEFEKLPRCLPNGNYDPLQCVQDKCFCMESSRYRKDEIFEAKDMKKLSCYNYNSYPEGNRKTRCLEQREEEIKHLKDENLILIGADRTRCEPDGTYYPLQCKKGRCSCVKRNGEILMTDLKKEEGDLMCRCMRDVELIQNNKEKTENMKKFEAIKCNKFYTSEDKILSKSFITDFIIR